MTAWEYEQCKERMEKEAVDLNASMENWRKKYEKLEEEKRVLFEEIMEQNSREKKTLENDKENMRSYIEQLEKSSEHPRNIKNFANLSQRQQKRRIQALGSRAEKALWFVSHFGLNAVLWQEW